MRSNKPLPSHIESVCILRLSAIGDVCLALPAILAMQRARPDLKITWVIGKIEYALVSHLPNIEFIIFDKAQSRKSYFSLWQTLAKRRFDVLLHMQLSLRASLASSLIRAKVTIGFDKARAKEGQWLFCQRRIPAKSQVHMAEAFWDFIREVTPEADNTSVNFPLNFEVSSNHTISKNDIVICPMASADFKTWPADLYASLIEQLSQEHGIVLCGGPSQKERAFAKEIESALSRPVRNLVGQTSLAELMHIIHNAAMVIAPDTGPGHMAALVGTAIIGLFACSDPQQTGPVTQHYLINQYPAAVKQHYSNQNDVPFGTRIKDQQCMRLITPAMVLEKVAQVLADQRNKEALKHETSATSHSAVGT